MNLSDNNAFKKFFRIRELTNSASLTLNLFKKGLKSLKKGLLLSSNQCLSCTSLYLYLFQRSDARTTCLSRGGDLASITSSQERNWLNNRLRAVSSWSNSFWIGLNDRDMSRHFYWSDGSPYRLKAWSPGAPSDFSSRSKC